MRGVEELDVFARAHKLTLQLYEVTSDFPNEELYALTSQIKRAANSICANLMEGSHRLGTREFRQFVGIANGSAGELKYHILLAKDLGYIAPNHYFHLKEEIDTICKMLRGLSRALSQKATNTNTKK
jgi:four helix bundle protein